MLYGRCFDLLPHVKFSSHGWFSFKVVDIHQGGDLLWHVAHIEARRTRKMLEQSGV